MCNEYLEESMDEEQLQKLISSLCILSKDGSIPLIEIIPSTVHTFTVLVSAAPCEKLAHHLHQRWLSEANFTKIAARIILHHQHMHETDLGLFSCCLGHVLSDFQFRQQIRQENRLVFRNSVRVMFDFYPVYKQIDATVSECLVEPIFTSLRELINDDPDEKDIEAAAELIIDYGNVLMKIEPDKCNNFITALRAHLCDSHLSSITRRLILQALDFWTYKWNDENFPFCIKQFNETSAQIRKNPKETSQVPSQSITDKNDHHAV
ncbi:unnamed protein product [Thelazia callipaeda]|uniref:MIF4G domain-containing protein n=1 Tax=Thelazia callipaeda TaxID=103827 RepID=A0A0N5CVY8_THECL|nr:unnamed protein product [Thelazia callipaeda]